MFYIDCYNCDSRRAIESMNDQFQKIIEQTPLLCSLWRGCWLRCGRRRQHLLEHLLLEHLLHLHQLLRGGHAEHHV